MDSLRLATNARITSKGTRTGTSPLRPTLAFMMILTLLVMAGAIAVGTPGSAFAAASDSDTEWTTVAAQPSDGPGKGETATDDAGTGSLDVGALAHPDRYIYIDVTLKSTSNRVCMMAESIVDFTTYSGCGPVGASAVEFLLDEAAPSGKYRVSAWEENATLGYTDEFWWSKSDTKNRYYSNATFYTAAVQGNDSVIVEIDFRGSAWLGGTDSVINLAASESPLLLGQRTDLTATVTGAAGTPTGIVHFYDDTQFLGDATLSGGTATLEVFLDEPVTEFMVYYRGNTSYDFNFDLFNLSFGRSVGSVSPGYGPESGGTAVTVKGTGFTGATGVTFDGVAGTSFSVVNNTQINVTTPAGTKQDAVVRVLHASGNSTPTDAATFAYTTSSIVLDTPVRIADMTPYASGVIQCFQITGRDGIPLGATGVLLNVTAAGATSGGYAVIYPDTAGDGSTAPPNSSTVNFETGRAVANAAFVALTPNGRICASTAGGNLSRLILDASGYFIPGSGVTLQSAQRLVDTRPGASNTGGVTGPIVPSSTYNVQVTGNASVPSGADAVVANVTVTGVTSGGHLRMWETGTTMPTTSVVNYAAGQTKANAQVIALSASGQLSFASFTGVGTATNPVNVIIDVVGYVSTSSQYKPANPTRIVETRSSGQVGPITSALVPGTIYPVELTNTTLVPANATAVVLNVTAVGPNSGGYAVVYPDSDGDGGTTPPSSSNINYIVGRAIPNLVIVKIPPNRTINVFSQQAAPSNRTNMVIDVVGYIAPPA